MQRPHRDQTPTPAKPSWTRNRLQPLSKVWQWTRLTKWHHVTHLAPGLDKGRGPSREGCKPVALHNQAASAEQRPTAPTKYDGRKASRSKAPGPLGQEESVLEDELTKLLRQARTHAVQRQKPQKRTGSRRRGCRRSSCNDELTRHEFNAAGTGPLLEVLKTGARRMAPRAGGTGSPAIRRSCSRMQGRSPRTAPARTNVVAEPCQTGLS